MKINEFKNNQIVLVNTEKEYLIYDTFNIGLRQKDKLIIGIVVDDHNVFEFDISYILENEDFANKLTTGSEFKKLNGKHRIICRLYKGDYQSEYEEKELLTDKDGILQTNHEGLIIPILIKDNNENELLNKIYKALGK